MEPRMLPDFGGRRTGIARRVLVGELPLGRERRSGEDRRTGLERRIRARFVSGTLKNFSEISFEKPSTLRKLNPRKDDKQ